MIHWLLRLFSDYREKERTIDELQRQNLMLQDRLDAALEDRSRLWSLMEKSIDEMKIAYQMHINAQWQKQGNGKPYPEAPGIHEAQLSKNMDPVVPRQMLPSEAVRLATSKFIQDYLKKS
jgi:hypothetical protein